MISKRYRQYRSDMESHMYIASADCTDIDIADIDDIVLILTRIYKELNLFIF